MAASSSIARVSFSRSKQPGLVAALYSGMQCSGCDARFPPEYTLRYSHHLDWHFRQNRRERDSARRAHSRHWHYDLSDWMQYEDVEDLEERSECDYSVFWYTAGVWWWMNLLHRFLQIAIFWWSTLSILSHLSRFQGFIEKESKLHLSFFDLPLLSFISLTASLSSYFSIEMRSKKLRFKQLQLYVLYHIYLLLFKYIYLLL